MLLLTTAPPFVRHLPETKGRTKQMQRRRPSTHSDHHSTIYASAHGGRWKWVKTSDEELTFTETAIVGEKVKFCWRGIKRNLGIWMLPTHHYESHSSQTSWRSSGKTWPCLLFYHWSKWPLISGIKWKWEISFFLTRHSTSLKVSLVNFKLFDVSKV